MGALIVDEEDEVLVVMASGKVMRSPVAGVPAKGRDTMGVVFAKFDEDDAVIGLAKNTERGLDTDTTTIATVDENATESTEGTTAQVESTEAADDQKDA